MTTTRDQDARAMKAADDLPGLAVLYMRAIWRRKWTVALICWVVCAIGWAGVFFVPDKFESQARVHVNVSSLLTPLLRGIAIDTNPSAQLNFFQQTLLSRPNLEQLVHLADLDARTQSAEEKDAQLRALAATITVKPQGPDLFTISYQNRNPVVAKNVVQGVVTIFAESTARSSRSEMDNAQRFLGEQIASYEKQLRSAEERRATFREKYADILPNAASGGGRLEAARAEVQKARLDLEDAISKRDSLRKEIGSIPQMLNVDQLAPVIINNGGTRSQTRIRLDEAQRQLDALLLRFTDQHPDVVALRRQIAALQTQADAEGRGGGGGGSSSSGTRKTSVSNVVYEQMKLRLVDAEGTVATMQRRLDEAKADEARMEAIVQATPGVELQVQNLDRDYEILKKNYEEMLARREATRIAEAADTQADKIQFAIVDAPQVPLKPVAPNRPLLFSGVLFAGLGASIGISLLLAQLDRSFATLSSLRALGLPVIGGVSMVDLIDMRRRRMLQIAGLGASAAALLIVYGALVAMSSGLALGVI
jgi:polysaccharide chain length determinant protein (PEP-CTERM system associated)